MNVFQLEDIRLQLLKDLQKEQTPFGKILILNYFIDKVLIVNETAISESFLTEFLEEYYQSIKNFSVFGIDIKHSELIISKGENLINHIPFSEYSEKLKVQLQTLKNDLNKLKEILAGEITKNTKSKFTFPVLVYLGTDNDSYGQLEHFSVKIGKEKGLKENKFLVIPSNKTVEEKLIEQIKISWDLAISYLKRYFKKPNLFHEIIIEFTHKHAQYEGYSLGLSLTLSFIQELFKLYSTPITLTVKENVTFTGGINQKGNIKEVGSSIIKKKVSAVFYSENNFFAVPENDLNAAKEELKELNKIFPARKLKLISVNEFEDLLNQRQIVAIEKTKITTRFSKFLIEKSLILFLTLLQVLFITFYLIYFTDDNPVEFKKVNQTLNIENKHGKILWSTKQSSHITVFGDDPKNSRRIYDIDKDGTNEVILSSEIFPEENPQKTGRIACFDNKGQLIWEYQFDDSVSTNDELFDRNRFNCQLIDIVEENGTTVLLGNARHFYFPSAIFKLNIRTGKRLPGTIWSQGHFQAGTVGDFNKDGKKELFVGGINNGLESAFAFLIDYNDLEGQTPSLSNYLFKDIPIAHFIKYFIFKKSDVCKYFGLRFNITGDVFYECRSNIFLVSILESPIKRNMGIVYRISNNLKTISTQLGDDLMFVRDSLVRKGDLKPPLTYDLEYSKILLNGIKEWDGKEFVKFKNKQ